MTAGLQTQSRPSLIIAESHRQVAWARAEAGRDARQDVLEQASWTLMTTMREVLMRGLGFLRHFAVAEGPSSQIFCAAVLAVTGLEQISPEPPGTREIGQDDPASYQPCPGHRSRRPILPWSKGNGRSGSSLLRRGAITLVERGRMRNIVSTVMARRGAACAIGTEYPPLKPYEAITQVPEMPSIIQ
ncbi:Nn.00g025510.m01.CDS01 [Neocucurbitaria sp. VM-36]